MAEFSEIERLAIELFAKKSDSDWSAVDQRVRIYYMIAAYRAQDGNAIDAALATFESIDDKNGVSFGNGTTAVVTIDGKSGDIIG